MASEIRAEIILELDKLKKQLQEAESESAKTGTKVASSVGKSLEGSLLSIGKTLAVATAAAIAAVGVALSKAISEASAAEQAVTRFNSALTASGQFSQQATDSFQAYAAGLQATLGVSDDLIVSNAALLVSIGKLSGEGLERGTKAALDLSAALGISLETATELVSKAATGNIATLNRYGLSINKARDDSQTFANALGAIESAFGGAALAKANTFSGAMDRLSLSFNDVFEEIGKAIIKSPKVIAAISLLAEQFKLLADSITSISKGGDPIGDLLDVLVGFAEGVTSTVLAPIELLGNVLMRPIKLLAGLGAAASALASGGGIRAAFEALKASAADSANLFDFPVTAQVQALTDKVKDALAAAAPALGAASRVAAKALADPFFSAGAIIRDAVGEAMADIAVKTQVAVDRISASLKTRLVGAFDSFKMGVANSFASIGAALVKGQNAFAAFGKAILGVFGDLAIQLGTFYFFLGLANLFLNPVAAAAQIAGGVALIALGGALKAIAGGSGGGGAAAPAAGGGGGAEIAPSGLVGAQAQSLEKQEVTQVTVNVQGNILDRKESGLAIADILNETFGGQGVVLATAR